MKLAYSPASPYVRKVTACAIKRGGQVERLKIGTTDPEPVEINRREIFRALEEQPVVVLSGFVGCDSEGRTSLLGRGGSDLTALFVAHRLGADTCRLIKDVDGLYEWDPSVGEGARRSESGGAGARGELAPIAESESG